MLLTGSNLHSTHYLKSIYPLLSFYLSTASLTPIQLLQSLTIIPSKLWNLENKIGVVEIGSFADLIMIRENPLLTRDWYQGEESILAVIQV